MEPEGTLRNPGPYGWCYYHSLVRVECGDKTGMPDMVLCYVYSLYLNTSRGSKSSGTSV